MTRTHDKKMAVLKGHEKTKPYLHHGGENLKKKTKNEYFKLILFKAGF